MKKILYSDIYNIKSVKNPNRIYNLLKESKTPITTYNKLMEYYEDNNRDIGIVFITEVNSIMFQHLPLFCKHFSIKLYALPSDAENTLNEIFDKKFVNIIGIKKDDPIYHTCLSIANE